MKLETTGYPVAFRNFPKNKIVKPPFVCYVTPSTETFAADGRVYHSTQNVQVELYTNEKDLSAEQNVESALADFFYEKDETYIHG